MTNIDIYILVFYTISHKINSLNGHSEINEPFHGFNIVIYKVVPTFIHIVRIFSFV